jgi:replicative DNA helicase
MARTNEDFIVVAEYRLLNALVHNKALLTSGELYEDVFVHLEAKHIYKALVELYEKKIRITPASLHQHANEINDNIRLDICKEVFEIDNGADTVDDILITLRHAIKKQKVIKDAEKLLTDVSSLDALDSNSALNTIFKIEQELLNNEDESPLKDIDTWLGEYRKEIVERQYKNTHIFGDYVLDNLLVKGAYPGAITIIAGATGQGKSTYALNLINSMLNQDIPCIYASLEMSAMDTLDRLISMRKEIPAVDLYHPKENIDAILNAVDSERKALENNKLFYMTESPDLSLSKLTGHVREFKQRTHQDFLILVVDLLTQVRDFTKSASGLNLAQSMELAMNQLNILAKEENIHIVGVVQFNRNADSVKLQSIEDVNLLRPTLNDIKNAHAIAERARAVISIFRPAYYAQRYLPDDPGLEYMDDVMEVQVLKQSNGPTGSAKYLFDGEIFKISPIAEEIVEDEETKQAKAVLANF